MKKVIVLGLVLVVVFGQKLTAVRVSRQALIARGQDGQLVAVLPLQQAAHVLHDGEAAEVHAGVQAVENVALVAQEGTTARAAKMLWYGAKASLNAAGDAIRWTWNNKVNIGFAVATILAMQHNPNGKLKILVGSVCVRGLFKLVGLCCCK